MKNFASMVLLLLTSGVGFGQVQLAVSDVKSAPGSKLLVPVALSEGKDISGIQFSVNFDGDLLSAPADKSPVPGELLTDHSVGANRQGNKLNVVVFSSSLSKLKPGSGTLLSLLFQVSAGAPFGRSTTVRISDIQASDSSGNPVAVTAREGTVFVTADVNLPVAGTNELLFPQIANGSFAGGSFITTLIFVNRTGAVTTAEARFFKSDGTPFAVKLADGRAGVSFMFTVPDGGSAFLQTDGSGPLSAGYARVSATGPLGGTILFSQLDAGGQTLAEAGVNASPVGTRFTIPVIYQKGAADTGIAFANVSSQPSELTLTLRDRAGLRLGSEKKTLSSGQHLPQFATEFFRLIAGQEDFNGSIEVSATAPISAVALKQQGTLITTFPVIRAQYVPPDLTNGGQAPKIEVTPSSLDFGAVLVGQSKDLSFTARNTGTGPLLVSSIGRTLPQFAVTSPSGGFSLAAGGQQVVTVRFSPSATGAVNDTLTISSNDASRPTVGMTLSGTGTAGGPPKITSVAVTKLDNDSARVDAALEDPDGDIVKLEFTWYLNNNPTAVKTANSPADVNLAGVTSKTVTLTFSGIGAPTPFGVLPPTRVDVEATDSKGLVSNRFSKTF